ncbi:hypothetical protein RLOatenuis_2940 [Rickettsiales bacterium]|nr:hypothetical protein RLOatenuis_2940 [Rickettsiales bacterium]
MNNVIYRAHKNSDKSFCIDGLGSLILMQIYELLNRKYHDNQREADFGFTTAAPVITQEGILTEKSNKEDAVRVIDPSLIQRGTRIVFCDCHPEPKHVEDDGSLRLIGKDSEYHKVSIEYVDHHDSVKEILRKVKNSQDCTSIPDANIPDQELAEILRKTTGCSLAAVKLVDLVMEQDEKLKEASSSMTKDKDTQHMSLQEESYKQKDTESKYTGIFDTMNKLAEMINKESVLQNEESVSLKDIFTKEIIDVFATISAIDLFSLGAVKESKELLDSTKFKHDLLQESEKIIQNLSDELKQKYHITAQTALLNVIEQHVKDVGMKFFCNKASKETLATKFSLEEEKLKKILEELGKVRISEEYTKTLGDKYGIVKLADKLYHTSKKINLKHKEKQEEPQITVIYMPFSPSSGCDKELLEELAFLEPEEREKFAGMVEGGAIREVEPIIQNIIERVQQENKLKKNDKVLVVMEGKTNVSLRANFPMMKDGKMTLEGYDFDGYGGHPSACGCAQGNKIVKQIREAVREERGPSNSKITDATSSIDNIAAGERPVEGGNKEEKLMIIA